MQRAGVHCLAHENIGHQLADAGNGDGAFGVCRKEHLAVVGVAQQNGAERVEITGGLHGFKTRVERGVKLQPDALATVLDNGEIKDQHDVGQAHVQIAAGVIGVYAFFMIVHDQLVAVGVQIGNGGRIVGGGIGRQARIFTALDIIGVVFPPDGELLGRAVEDTAEIGQGQIEIVGVAVLIRANGGRAAAG